MLTIHIPLLRPLALLTLLAVVHDSFASDPIKGSDLYAKHCAICHGASGISVMTGAPNFAQGEGLLMSDVSLLESIEKGKNAMPFYKNILSSEDILNIIAYLRTLN